MKGKQQMDKNILKMKNISKAFAVPVLKNVNFNLKKGEVHALVGGNGAGKSTLMKIMCGVYTKDSGEIQINDESVEINNIYTAGQNGIAMIFQELSLIPTMTVSENIFLGNEDKQGLFRDTKGMNVKASKLLHELGLKINPNTPINKLSVGESQMIEIAKALAKKATILIMDEPTASLSEKETKQLFKIIKDLKSKGVSIVYISHRMSEIIDIADRITVLRDGGVVYNGEVQNIDISFIVKQMLGEEKQGMEYNSSVIKDSKYSDEVLLKVEDLNVDELVNNINFELHKGEILGLAGLMGSGRTEIVEALFGIRGKIDGKVSINGRNVISNNAYQAIQNGFALVPEDRRKEGLVLEHSLKENVILPKLKFMFRSGIITEKRIDEIALKNITHLNILTDGIYKSVSLLSGGNQQKVVFAKWLNMNPEVLMLDEPTAGVDVGAKQEIIDIMRDYAQKGKGVILISSEISELMAACDRIIVLFDGKITNNLKRRDIESEEFLQNAIQIK